ncbi:MAG TPA: hypothetical protein PKG71_03190 [Candidatus Woesebacteria bacterium]|nr:hypothetical protein [Candidatus Woesebacteria bacterium]HNS94948.1 hypothetical protein [Candidatus Woesebacteria bacterium]
MIIYLIALIPLALVITALGMRQDMKKNVASVAQKRKSHHTQGTIMVLEDGPQHYR